MKKIFIGLLILGFAVCSYAETAPATNGSGSAQTTEQTQKQTQTQTNTAKNKNKNKRTTLKKKHHSKKTQSNTK
jgi:hypothetical protein